MDTELIACQSFISVRGGIEINKIQATLAELYHYRGDLEYQRNNLIQAQTFFKKSLEIEPDHAETLFNLGLCLGRQGNYSEAEKTLIELREIYPSNRFILFYLDETRKKL